MMAYGLNSLRRLFQQRKAESAPTLGSDREVYELFRQMHNKTGGPNEELRRLYVSYLKNTDGAQNFCVVGADSHKDVPAKVRLRRGSNRRVGSKKGLQTAQ